MTRLVVGLGNPGLDYVGTRHNCGYEVVEALAKRHKLLFSTASRSPAAGSPLEGYRGARAFRWARATAPDLWLVQPTTYMNDSGVVVAPLVHWLALPPERLLVVFDDLDLVPGALRIRPHGGHGGHNGMRSIQAQLGSQAFPRVRVGIGRPGTDAARYVLEPFSPDERVLVDIAVAQAAEAIDDWLVHGDLDATMSRFHSRWSL